jgi:hypothetical protein
MSQAPLFDSTSEKFTQGREHAHARRTDPIESHLAAERASLRLNETQERVHVVLKIKGPATDEELISRFRHLWPEAKVTDQSIRSRRSELCRKGLVRQTDRYGVTDYGNRARVWEVV